MQAHKNVGGIDIATPFLKTCRRFFELKKLNVFQNVLKYSTESKLENPYHFIKPIFINKNSGKICQARHLNSN